MASRRVIAVGVNRDRKRSPLIEHGAHGIADVPRIAPWPGRESIANVLRHCPLTMLMHSHRHRADVVIGRSQRVRRSSTRIQSASAYRRALSVRIAWDSKHRIRAANATAEYLIGTEHHRALAARRGVARRDYRIAAVDAVSPACCAINVADDYACVARCSHVVVARFARGNQRIRCLVDDVCNVRTAAIISERFDRCDRHIDANGAARTLVPGDAHEASIGKADDGALWRGVWNRVAVAATSVPLLGDRYRGAPYGGQRKRYSSRYE